MSAPAGLIMAKIIIPEIKQAKVNEEIEMVKDDSANVVDAEFVDVEITPEEVYGTNVNDENNEKTNDSRDGE